MGKKQTKFIASTTDKNDIPIGDLAKTLHEDGITVEHVSEMLGYITGKSNLPLKELQDRYLSKGLNIELDKQVGIE